ncbi:MAG TPA: tRNA adenosine(34) deaminase TadA [bacterium]|nr:tRNA adenosine(34) deaminase TadA [bacterium]HPN42915.1 tRNA adenosine(34) deaminase TadA [bacterium]
MDEHFTWMREALREAEKAYRKQEVPIGAVIVLDGHIIGRGHNLIETLQDATAHAEMLAINAASRSQRTWRLNDSILYTTLEPCAMCTGAILLARISHLVFGARDPRYGACGSVLQLAEQDKLDIRVPITGGILETECSLLLKDFFAQVRQRRNSDK